MDKKIIKDLKKYSQIGTLAISAVVTIILGVGLGLLMDYLFETTYWIIVISIIFLFIAVANFIYHIYKLGK